MKKVYYNKLVRDKIPEIIKKDGAKPVIKKLSEKRFKEELRKKIIEEAKEVFEAKGREELLKECADLQEVLITLMDAEKISFSELNTVRRKRKKDRGGFEKRVFLVQTVSKD